MLSDWRAEEVPQVDGAPHRDGEKIGGQPGEHAILGGSQGIFSFLPLKLMRTFSFPVPGINCAERCLILNHSATYSEQTQISK